MDCYEAMAIIGSPTTTNTNIVIENNKFNISYTPYGPSETPPSRRTLISRSPSPEEMAIIYLDLDASNTTLDIRDNMFRNTGKNPLYHIFIITNPINESIVRICNNEFYGIITEYDIDYGVWIGGPWAIEYGIHGLLGNSTVIVENNKFNDIISTIIADARLANNTKVIVRNNVVNGGIGAAFVFVTYMPPLTIDWGAIIENEVYNNVYDICHVLEFVMSYNIDKKYWMLVRNITTTNSIGAAYFLYAYGIWVEDCLFKNITYPEGPGVIAIGDVDNFTLTNCRIINCSTGLYISITGAFLGGDVFIKNNLIKNCSTGVVFEEIIAPVIMERNTIIDNDIGIYALNYNMSGLVFRLNTITGNNIGLLSEITEDYPPIDVRLNWWGHWTGPYNETTNPEGLGDEIKGRAIYRPWLLNEPGRVPMYSLETTGIEIHEVTLDTPDYKATAKVNATQPLEVALTTYNVTPIQDAVAPGLKVLGMGVDIWVNNTNAVQWPIRIELKLKKPVPEGIIPLLYYYNKATGRYVKCSNTGYDPATRTVWAYLTREEYEAGIGTPLVPLGSPTIVGGKLLVEQTKTPDTLATILAAITLTAILTTLIVKKR